MRYSASSVLLVALMATASSAFQVSYHGTTPRTAATCTLPLYATTTTTKDDETAAVNPRFEGLALMLDDGTRKSHSVAQNSAFVTGFFKGLSTREAYRELITSYYFVYQAMEGAFEKSEETIVTALDDKELRRLPALEQDMEFFYGENWKNQIKMSPSTKTYVDRVNEVADSTPFLLVAHQYTRYLGDLFGGQMMSGMAQRSLDLEKDKGVDFYNFKDITSVKDFITDWYTRLNALDLDEDQKQTIVDEANYVFDLNIGILEELDGNPLKAVWSLAINTLQVKLGLKEA
jgi:heme oxygenase